MTWINIEDSLPGINIPVIIKCKYGERVDFFKAVLVKRKKKYNLWMNPDTGYIYGGEITHRIEVNVNE